jgi:hypothetical protein
LTNIQKNKDAALKQLDIQYAAADKAKQSFGYIGITFLACLFGTVFLNDFIKLCIHCCRRLRVWWRKRYTEKKIDKENNDFEIELKQSHTDELLEETLEKVYFRLVKASTDNKKQNNEFLSTA